MKKCNNKSDDFDHAPSPPSSISRREFLKLGGGIVVYFFVGDALAGVGPPGFSPPSPPTDFNAYLRIREDGRVTCFTGKIEEGQGIITSLAQMLADELDVSLDSIDMTMGDTDLCPFDMGTMSSLTIRAFGPVLRAAAAEAKAVLKAIASEQLSVPADRLQAKNGTISDKTSGKSITYAQLTKGKKIERYLSEKPPLKDRSEFGVMGKSFSRSDALEKVTGKARFAGDIRLPGMLYAKILRPPTHGAQLTDVDTSGVTKIEGVQIVRNGDLIAVLHELPDKAQEALTLVKARFKKPEISIDNTTIFKHLLTVAPKGKNISEGGNLETGKKAAVEIFENDYFTGYVAHASIETHTAVAQVKDNTVTVWASTQTPFRAQKEVAKALDLSPLNVRIITPFVGGGFGGKAINKQAVEAARLAKLTGKPVQVAWSREEEFFFDSFRPASIVTVKSGINESGKITFWDYVVYYAGELGSQLYYTVPNHKISAHGSWFFPIPGTHPIGSGPWRGTSHSSNTFAIESHVDVMASKAGKDPLEFRLNNLSDKRMRGVLKAAAKKFGWTPAKAPSGRGRGLACGICADTYVAVIAEVDVDRETGNVRVKRVVCALDMGIVINPEGAQMQIEGGITMALGYALTEEVNFRGGEIFDLSFETYKIPRFSWLPKIEPVLLESHNSPPSGGGEPPVICIGAAVANAIHDATGARGFQLPITPDRIKHAIRKL